MISLILSFTFLRGFLFRCHENQFSVSVPFRDPAKVKSQEAKRFSSENIDDPGLITIEGDPERFQFLLETLQCPFRPSSLGVVSADCDHNIIRKPMIVDRFIRAFGSLATNFIERPIDLIEVDIRCQRTERASLGTPTLPVALMICFTSLRTCGS